MSEKIRRGDRKDGTRVREADAMHAFMPYLMPNRADNEAVMTERVDLGAIQAYVNRKNAENPEFKYTFFHVIAAALAKTIALRPKMNRFYSGHRLYDRREISLSFVVKKQFYDDSEEALALVKVDKNGGSALEQIHSQVQKIVQSVRKEAKLDGTTEKMGILLKLPRPVLRLAMRILRWLDYHGRYPQALMMDDPYYTSVFISNLGSIHMNSSYHHLTNWGTNSFFVIIGEKKKTPVYLDDGVVELHDTLDLSMTVDERIADGLYYAHSVQLLRRFLQNPELLDLPVAELPEEPEKVVAG